MVVALQMNLVLGVVAAAAVLTLTPVLAGELPLGFGPSEGDAVFLKCDDCCHQIVLPAPIDFFNVSYSSIYVCSNGNLNFGRANKGFNAQPFPLTTSQYVMIALWYVDMDIIDSFVDQFDDYYYDDYYYYGDDRIVTNDEIFDDGPCDSDDPADFQENTRFCNYGLLEVWNGTTWGAFCAPNSDSFLREGAMVACSSVGYQDAFFAVDYEQQFPDGEVLYSVECEGDEESLFDCAMEAKSNCDPTDQVHVYCHNDGHAFDDEATAAFFNSISSVPNLKPNLVGNIFYRNCSDADMATVIKVLKDTYEAAGDGEVVMSECFVATYYMVMGYYQPRGGGNTFQGIVGSATVDGEPKTAVVIAYETLQWAGLIDEQWGDRYPSAGFNDAKGNYFNLPGANTAAAGFLVDDSNVGRPGVWAFLLDPVEGISRCPSPPIVIPQFAPYDAAATVLLLGYCNATEETDITINVVGSETSANDIPASISGSFIQFNLPVWNATDTVTLEVFIDGQLHLPTIQFELVLPDRAALVKLSLLSLIIGVLVNYLLV